MPLAVDALAVGAARLTVEQVAGQSTAVAVAARSPARLLVPKHRGRAPWCYVTSFGGGLVAGDDLDLTVQVGPGAHALLTTQASTKVYRDPDCRWARQGLVAEIAADAVLVNLPDQVTCFRAARYRACNHYRLAPSASLLACDWYSAGRSRYGAGEDWAFAALESTTTVERGGRRVLYDGTALFDSPGLPTMAQRMGPMRAIATVYALGPALAGLAAVVDHACAEPATDQVVMSASAVDDGGRIWRLAGRSVASVASTLRAVLASTVCDLVGGDPWARSF
jgi:urease accessory protein